MTHDLFPPYLQQRYEQILARIRQFQKELGIQPQTLAEKYQDFLIKKEQEQLRAAELEKFKNLIGIKKTPGQKV